MKLRIVISNEETGEVIRDLTAEDGRHDKTAPLDLDQVAQEIVDAIEDGDYRGYTLKESKI